MSWKIALCLLLATALPAADEPPLHHAEHSGGFTLAFPINKAFPLFEPMPEKQWADGWDPKPVYPPSGETAEGMVFVSSDRSGPDVVWTLAHFDAEHHEITYINVVPGVRLGRIDIHCSEASGGTRVDVRYSFTALSEPGNEFVDMFTQSRFDSHMEAWQHAISYFLQTGKRFQHHASL